MMSINISAEPNIKSQTPVVAYSAKVGKNNELPKKKDKLANIPSLFIAIRSRIFVVIAHLML